MRASILELVVPDKEKSLLHMYFGRIAFGGCSNSSLSSPQSFPVNCHVFSRALPRLTGWCPSSYPPAAAGFSAL